MNEPRPYLQILQHEGTMFPKRFDQAEDARIFRGDAVGDGGRDADDFLEHLDKGVVFVLARFNLAGFHAEGGFEVHSLHSVVVFSGLYRGRWTERRGLGENKDWGGVPIWYGGDVLCEVCDPFRCLDRGHGVMH